VSRIESTRAHQEGNFLFYGLIVYTALFFLQPAGRFPILAPLRLEFVVGAIILISIVIKILSGSIKLDDNRLNAIAIVFMLILMLTIPFAYVKTRALNTFITVAKVFAIYLMIIAAIRTERQLKTFIIAYLAVISLIFLQPFFLSLMGKGFIYNNHMWRLAGPRGIFGHPNALGMIVAMHLPFYYFFMRYAGTKGRIVCFLLILIGLRVIMLTQSRTAFLGVLTFAGLLWISFKRKLLARAGFVAELAIAWQFAPQQTKDRFLTLGRSAQVITEDRGTFSYEENIELGSMASRWELARRALIAFTEYPVIGLGLDCFSSYNGRRWGLWFPPHNTYLQALAESGIVGFSALIVLIAYTLRNLREARKRFEEVVAESRFLRTVTPAVTWFYWIFIVVAAFGIEIYSNAWWIAGGLSVVILRIVDGYRLSDEDAARND
jgi:O-antigen ligase